MGYRYKGQCECGKSQVQLQSSLAAATFTPRACHCEFCVARGIQYVSDANGRVVVSTQGYQLIRQGSEQADFITCATCETVLAVSVKVDTSLIGALNATLLCDVETSASPVSASPKQLSPDEKKRRWQQIWGPLELD